MDTPTNRSITQSQSHIDQTTL
ncbi:unnamed protein product, partial [Rotaria sp. Silwood1]